MTDVVTGQLQPSKSGQFCIVFGFLPGGVMPGVMQDFPTLRLIFRSADERRPDRDVLAGFCGCMPARAPMPARFSAPDDWFWMSGGIPADAGRCGVSGPGQGRVRAAMASRRLARLSARAMVLRLGLPDRCPCGPCRRPRRRRSLSGDGSGFPPPGGRGSGGAVPPAPRRPRRGR